MDLVVLEKEYEEIKEKKKLSLKIKEFFKNDIFKKAIFITLFFCICYVSTEALNGNDMQFDKLFGANVSWEEKSAIIESKLDDFFKFPKFICNLAIYIFLYLIVYGLTNRTKLSCTIVSGASVVFGIINYIVMQVRGIAITVSDVYAIQTAANVAKGIRPEFNENFIFGITIFAFAMLILWRFAKFNDKDNTKTFKRKFATSILGVFCVMFLFMFEPLMNDVAIWDINASYANSGAGLTLMRMIKDLKIKKPEKYNVNDVKEILASFKDDVVDFNGELPNVIVVMNESFADLEKVFNIELQEDNISYFHELVQSENVISGMMHSSKYGGGTSNVEYEFLTQNTTAFLPTGSIPFQQYISRKVNESIVTTMNELNYNSYGIHSWYKNGYSRGKVYNLLQFNNSIFKESMDNLENELNEYPTDISTYEYWFDIMNKKQKDEKNFTFIVTMQNHLPYNNVDYNRTQYVYDNDELNSYLQYEKMSDDALKGLIEFLEEYEEDTVLLFFGDHQPNLSLEEKYGSNGVYSIEESSYVVPFFIWANYDIKKQPDIEISTNYLQSLLFDVADLPKDSYTKYISELRSYIPVITAQYYIDIDGNFYEINDKSSPYYDKLKEYWKMIYYQMFDNK